MKKAFKWLLVILAIPYILVTLFVTFCLINYNDYKITEYKDTSLVIVEDDTLEPKFHKGDLLVIRKNAIKEVKAGDYAFFYNVYNSEVSVNLAPITKVTNTSGAEPSYFFGEDKEVSQSNFIGKSDTTQVYKGIGGLLKFFESRLGYILIFILPILVVFLYEIYAIVKEIKNPSEDE